MRRFLFLAILFFPALADAYPAMPKSGSFGKHLAKLRWAAAHRGMKTFARLTSSDFTVGEELDRASSLDVVRSDPRELAALVRLIDHGTCQRTGPDLVQCELPGRSTLGIFQHTRRGWRLGLFVS